MKSTRPHINLFGADIPDELPKVVVNTGDEFGPGSAAMRSDDTRVFGHRAGIVFHNRQIVDAIVHAVFRSVEMGCPAISAEFPLFFAYVDEPMLRRMQVAAGTVADTVEPGSLDWLCLNLYVNWGLASFLAGLEVPPMMIAEHTAYVGATAREIELHVLNRKDLEDRRKSKKAFVNNEGARAANDERRGEAEAWRAHARQIMKGLNLDRPKSEIARSILRNWSNGLASEDVPPPPEKLKTVQNWLSQELSSRAR